MLYEKVCSDKCSRDSYNFSIMDSKTLLLFAIDVLNED